MHIPTGLDDLTPEKERAHREILAPRCHAAILDHDAGALLP
jgi:hypothetical protein